MCSPSLRSSVGCRRVTLCFCPLTPLLLIGIAFALLVVFGSVGSEVGYSVLEITQLCFGIRGVCFASLQVLFRILQQASSL